MAIAHKNYRPPAGTVEVANDPSYSWNGQRWMRAGRAATPPRGRVLRGKPGTSMAGWTYDWSQNAWIQPTAAQPPAVTRPPITRLPVPVRPPPIAAAPPPVVVVPTAATPTSQETHMSCNCHQCRSRYGFSHQEPNLIDAFKRSPYFPLAGIALSVLSDFMKQPVAPTIPEGLPPHFVAQWNANYNENLATFERRKAMLDKYAMMIFGASSAQAVLTELARHEHLLKREAA